MYTYGRRDVDESRLGNEPAWYFSCRYPATIKVKFHKKIKIINIDRLLLQEEESTRQEVDTTEQ